jgi:histidinol dehydrogenase
VKIRTISTASPFAEVQAILRQESVEDPTFRAEVAAIIASVATRGDAGLIEQTARLDNFSASEASELRVNAAEFSAALKTVPTEVQESLAAAADNIRQFHQRQIERGFLDLHPDGSVLGQRILPLESVGIYVPGGIAAYPSSVLMNAIPAKVAGVERITMVSPATGGRIEPGVLAAAHIAGVDEIFKIGGAQAIAALAYGTESVRRVDKIVGPGNRWVAEAKRQVFGRVSIDMIAGPSEVLVIADGSADPCHIAADMIAQAEHDADAIAWLVTTDASVAEAVPAQLEELLARNPRREIAVRSLEAHGLIAVVPDLMAAAAVADLRAPEHLELMVASPLELAGRIRNAGAIFLGAFTPEPVGDYFAGPNHVLPTGGTARWASPLGVYEFVKRTSILGYSRERLLNHAEHVMRLAELEGLHGHVAAIRVRLPS